jgi:hypothetical protein
MEQNIDLTKLSDKDKQELNQVLTNEAQKSNIQQSEFLTLLPRDRRNSLVSIHYGLYFEPMTPDSII